MGDLVEPQQPRDPKALEATSDPAPEQPSGAPAQGASPANGAGPAPAGSAPSKPPRTEEFGALGGAEVTPRPPTPPETLAIGTASAWARTATVLEGFDDDAAFSLRNERLSLLGEGSQGRVYLVRHLGQLEAHKFLGRQKGRSLLREALHTRLVNHPNIVKVFGTEEVDSSLVLRMEYVDGRDMAQVVVDEGILPVAELAPLAVQVADALRAAHEAGIVHQDLKPSNLILHRDRQRVVVTDFGVSAALRSQGSAELRRRAGTPIFMSPELLAGRAGATPRADIWSLGVTLYYLACGLYPFPFDSLPPLEATSHAPRDPCGDAPHVPRAFWAILERMLARDGEQSYASMADVHQDLVDFAERIECPACAEKIELGAIERACPQCGSQRILPWRDVQELRRKAETDLARCSFDSSAAGFGEAAGVARAAGFDALVPELEQLARTARERGRECQRALQAIHADFGEDRLVEGVARLQETWVRYSRSAGLKALRSDRDRALLRLYHETEPRAARELRHGRFDAARAVLDRLGVVLADPLGRAALEHAVGHAPDDFAWLRDEVQRKESVFRELSAQIDAAIAVFDFEGALAALGRLEDEFPSEENVLLMRRLRRASETFATARPCPDERLDLLLAEPLAEVGEPLPLAAAAEACNTLLADFPVAAYPSFERIGTLRRKLLGAAGAIHDAVFERRGEAARLEQERRLRGALDSLESIRERVLASDVFGAEERESLESDVGRLRELADRAAELYRDGLAARERREYAKAQLALREVANIAPHDFPDAEAFDREIETVRDRAAALSEQVTKEFAEVRRGRFTPESAGTILEQAEALWELSDDTRRARLEVDLGDVLAALVQSQREYLDSQPQLGPQETSVFLGEALVPLVGSLSAPRWLAIQAATPELQRVLAALTGRGLEELAHLDLADALPIAQGRLDALRPLAEPLAAIAPEHADELPSLTLGRGLFESFRRASRGEERRFEVPVTGLLRELGALTTPAASGELHDLADRARRLATRATWARLASRAGRVALYLAPLFLAAAGGLFFGRELGVEASARERGATYGAWVGELGLPPSEARAARNWLHGRLGSQGSEAERASLLRAWADLREAPATTSLEASSAWLALAPRRDLLAGVGLEELRAVFDRDVARAVDVAVLDVLARALAGLDGVTRNAGVVRESLRADLLLLERGLPADAPARVALDGLTALLSPAGAPERERALEAALAAGALVDYVAAAFAEIDALEPDPAVFSAGVAEDLRSYLKGELGRRLVARMEDAVLEAQLGGVADVTREGRELVGALAFVLEAAGPRALRGAARAGAAQPAAGPHAELAPRELVDRVLDVLEGK